MCTVTVVPAAGGLRMICNRDERIDRAPALPPAARRFGDRVAIAPLDPEGGGSCIGVNDAGLTIVLLNRSACTKRRAQLSRGHIVTTLLQEATLDGMPRAVLRLNVDLYEPFRVLALHSQRALLADVRRGRLELRPFQLTRPRFLTSSSVDSAAAVRARATCFRRLLLRTPGDPAVAQGAFHRYYDRNRPALGVVMTRADARTVSRTSIDLRRTDATLTYESLDAGSRPVRCDICF